MNRTKEQIKEKVDSLRKEAEKLGVVLEIDENNFFEKRQHHMWYGGEIASFEYKGITVYIEAIGDIYITLNDENGEYVTHVKDKSNSCNFFHGMRDYIPDDKTLIEYLGWERDADSDVQPRLEITDNNWIEYNLYDNKTNMWIDCGDNVMEEEDVLDAVDLVGLMKVVDEHLSEKTTENSSSIEIKVLIENGMVSGVYMNEAAHNLDLDVTVIDFDKNLGSEDEIMEKEIAGLTSSFYTLTHCMKEEEN